jgi:hypothetical protein
VTRRSATHLTVLALLLVPAAPARAESVGAALEKVEASAQATPDEVRAWASLYRRSRSAIRRLRGREQENLRGVVRNVENLARRSMLPARARSAFLVLGRNYDWFWTRRKGAAGYGARTRFGESELFYVFYPGSGWQFQPLITFVHMNDLLALRRSDARLRALGEELLTLGVERKGFLAYEYLFPFEGGPPGWTSGMSQATGMQGLAGMWKRTGDERYLRAAQRMLGAFQTGPPWGVRVDSEGGAHYLLYSHSPRLLVGNGFAQALIGLDAYADATGDGQAAALVAAGLQAARGQFPRYDTGDWSLYHLTPSGPGRESTLTYHRLFADFLGQMCARFAEDLFCRIEANFDRYETEPVELTGLSARTRDRRTLELRFRASKRSTMAVRVLRRGRVERSETLTVYRGVERVRFSRPRAGGAYRLELEATSLTGLKSEATLDFSLRRPADSDR